METDPTEPRVDTVPTSNQQPQQDEQEQPPAAFTVNDRRFWNLDEAELEAESGRPRAPTFIEQLQQQVAEKDGQLREYIAAYKEEVVQGLAKTQERLERDTAQKLEQLRGQVAEPMMEVLDVMERSLAAAASNPTVESLHQGLQMVHLLMVQKLQDLGLERVASVGHPFDPARHEAVAVASVSDPAQNNIVLAEIKPGFTLGQRLIRPAQVQVGRLA